MHMARFSCIGLASVSCINHFASVCELQRRAYSLIQTQGFKHVTARDLFGLTVCQAVVGLRKKLRPAQQYMQPAQLMIGLRCEQAATMTQNV